MLLWQHVAGNTSTDCNHDGQGCRTTASVNARRFPPFPSPFPYRFIATVQPLPSPLPFAYPGVQSLG